jgi:hypothetical protein
MRLICHANALHVVAMPHSLNIRRRYDALLFQLSIRLN